jgi:hypothetical protein
MMRATQAQIGPDLFMHFGPPGTIGPGTVVQQPPEEKLKLLKESVKAIEAERFDGTARKRIETKANRLHNAGAVAQAVVLENELRRRDSLVRLKEWDYKLLTKQSIEKFSSENRMTLTRDGLKVHIDPIESYVGSPESGEAKDRIIPDMVLDKLEEAKERELFDTFHVLWAEKVKDPLLLGGIDGCEDYFFICEWGDDITFEQLTQE